MNFRRVSSDMGASVAEKIFLRVITRQAHAEVVSAITLLCDRSHSTLCFHIRRLNFHHRALSLRKAVIRPLRS